MLDAPKNASASRLRSLIDSLLGRPSDWHLRRPAFRRPQPGLKWAGPLSITVSVAVSWLAFDGAVGEGGNAAFAQFIGATSILLMSWSFILAIRLSRLEPFFGGLDRMYRVHRWCGALAVVAMFLHTSSDPELDQGIRGAGEATANSAEELAGVGEVLLYVLVAISIVRWFPYRYWRWTHKLLGLPFAFACFHFFAAEKPYANGSAWGWRFNGFMIAGLAAWTVRVVGRDMVARGLAYHVASAVRVGSTLDLRLAPDGSPLRYVAGQFVVVKIQQRGLSEPHIFTIAAAPTDRELRFFIRDLGDWTSKMKAAHLTGTRVLIEGPYGEFDPIGHGTPTVWIAGGVGITPFLSAAAGLAPRPDGHRPVLFYSVSDRADAMAIDVLERADTDGLIDLVVLASNEGNRFDRKVLSDRFGPADLAHAHVAVCGPAGLVAAVERAARSLGAKRIEREDFDIRQGFGPDLSTDVERIVSRLRRVS